MSKKRQRTATKRNGLSPTQRMFVIARARGKSVAESAEIAGIDRTTPAAHWDMEVINQCIADLQMSWVTSPIDALAPLLPLALEQLEELIKGREFEAIQELFIRVWGKPIQRSEITGKDGNALNINVTFGNEND